MGFVPPVENGFVNPEAGTDWALLALGSQCSGADPNCQTCYLDGFEHDCGHVMSLAQAGALQIELQNGRGEKKNSDANYGFDGDGRMVKAVRNHPGCKSCL